MTNAVRIVLAGVVVLAATGAAAQTVDELVQKNLEALGGAEAWRQVEALQRSGTMTGPEGQHAQVTTWEKRPNLRRQDVRIGGQIITTAFDGERFWLKSPQMGDEAQVLGGEAAELARVEASFDPPFLDYEKRGIGIVLEGQVDVDGQPAHKLAVSFRDGPSATVYLDERTGLVLRNVMEGEVDGQAQVREERLSDWRAVDGIRLPFQTEIFMNGHRVTTVTLGDVMVNPRIDDSVFQP